MTAPAIAPSHRVLSSNGGDAGRYAEQLLHRHCRQWGITPVELKGTGAVGRPKLRCAGAVRGHIITGFIRDIEDHLCCTGNHETNDAVSATTLAVMLNMTERSVRRYVAAVRRYVTRPSLGAAATGQALAKGPVGLPRQDNSTQPGPRLTGYDRASMEELSLGGGAG